MWSSGSTPSRRPRAPVSLFVRVVGDDHPKACTGRRLVHRGLARTVGSGGLLQPPVLLDPFAPEPLSPSDRETARRGGFLVVDCSWNRLGKRGGFPQLPGLRRDGAVRRRLPLLIATNPQHYGRVAELNTVEAFAAGLFVIGRPDEARGILAGFAGGDGFLAVNRERFEAYAAARSAADVQRAERALFGPSES